MSNFEIIELLFCNLLTLSKNDLSEAERKEVQVFLDVGEYGLALETAVDIYVEEKKKPSTDVVSLLEKLAIAMLMNPDSALERLRE